MPAQTTEAGDGRPRILVVDDEDLVRMVTRTVLTYSGFLVVEAVDGEDAVQKYLAAARPFDLVLMDLHMPRLDGGGALRRMRERHPALKAIFLSGGMQDSDFESPEDLAGTPFLYKPFENEELVRLVRETLGTA
jgi:CheY-like chemotaxis protein